MKPLQRLVVTTLFASMASIGCSATGADEPAATEESDLTAFGVNVDGTFGTAGVLEDVSPVTVGGDGLLSSARADGFNVRVSRYSAAGRPLGTFGAAGKVTIDLTGAIDGALRIFVCGASSAATGMVVVRGFAVTAGSSGDELAGFAIVVAADGQASARYSAPLPKLREVEPFFANAHINAEPVCGGLTDLGDGRAVVRFAEAWSLGRVGGSFSRRSVQGRDWTLPLDPAPVAPPELPGSTFHRMDPIQDSSWSAAGSRVVPGGRLLVEQSLFSESNQASFVHLMSRSKPPASGTAANLRLWPRGTENPVAVSSNGSATIAVLYDAQPTSPGLLGRATQHRVPMIELRDPDGAALAAGMSLGALAPVAIPAGARPYDFVRDGLGRFWLAISASPTTRARLIRLKSDGTLDPTFATSGIASLDLLPNAALQLQGNGVVLEARDAAGKLRYVRFR
jgi:hypothetical protein